MPRDAQLLAAQAVDVLAKYRRRVTVPEYVILATALHDTSDTAGERGVLVQAVADLSKETPFQQAIAWRKWACFNFEQKDFRTARRAVRRSLDAVAPIDDVRRLDRFETLLSWFEYEVPENAVEVAHLNSVLDQAEEVLRTVTVDEWRVKRLERVREARLRLDGKPTTPTQP